MPALPLAKAPPLFKQNMLLSRPPPPPADNKNLLTRKQGKGWNEDYKSDRDEYTHKPENNSFPAVKVTVAGKVVTPPGQLANAQQRMGLLQQSNLQAGWVHPGTNWALSVAKT